jgi:hypothetical protein
MRFALLFAPLTALAVCAFSASAQERPKEELVDKVKKAIDQGVKFLRSQQRSDGSWEVNIQGAGIQGGWTALSVLALLNAGVPANDPAIQRGLRYLRELPDPILKKPQESQWTYVRALMTMVYAEAGQIEDKQRIVDNVNWLIKQRVFKNDQFKGWTYSAGMRNIADGSNTQYAVLGLWSGRQGGAIINREIWEGLRDFYQRTQLSDPKSHDFGGFEYSERGGPMGPGATLTMTEAGICGLLIAAMELNSGRETPQPDGSFKGCGVYPEDTHLKRAMSWMSKRGNFRLEIPQATFYNLYGIERVGRLSGQRFIGPYDWYREGSQWLVDHQKTDGSWSAQGAWDQWPVVSTSFSLLFLSKGRTPVLISKLVHGPRDINGDVTDSDWNNDRNDLRHLTDFASRKLFKGMPLAWQSFDILRALQGSTNNAKIAEVTGELLPSPIAYFNGHRSPALRFDRGQDDGGEKRVLKSYLENGGFLFVEACCASKEFDRGFRAIAKELWPDNPLAVLDGNHPVWSAKFAVTPGRVSKLEGINLGCKTVLIYSPQDLSCRWESNKLDDPLNNEAFELGANIIAYATGLEPPAPRGTKKEVPGARKDPFQIPPRGFFEVGQLRHGGDAKVAPRAMRNLMDRLNQEYGLDVVLKTKFDLQLYSEETIDYKFLYMHGRGDIKADSNPESYKNLRFNLENGGLLFADACCGKEAFDKSFRQFVSAVFPEKEYTLQRIPLDDELFSKDLSGEALTDRNIKCRTERNGPMRAMPPWLEGIKYKNRWVVIYSKYDIGCALEKHQSSDCIGYDVESAYRLAGAVVLYTLKP